jgi:GxxExxY protein
MLYHKEITEIIIGASIEVHRELGPGLLESSYAECLYYELKLSGLQAAKQVMQPIHYKDVQLDAGYRIDLLVEGKVLVEIKAVEEVSNIHRAQLMTYLKLSGCKVGLLINFNVLKLMDGFQRFAM